ncbi:hypothetical protein N7475_000638 [Penicillium sp. IBT 31633x]|nr:hypothetical protein N7475_000638 [Penicillium sp. IBT 31633x]
MSLARLASCVSQAALFSWLLQQDYGKVTKQGSYAQLRDDIAGSIQLNDTNYSQPDETKEVQKPMDLLLEPPIPISDTSSVSPVDGGRQATELAVYKYYFSALSWSFRVV